MRPGKNLAAALLAAGLTGGLLAADARPQEASPVPPGPEQARPQAPADERPGRHRGSRGPRRHLRELFRRVAPLAPGEQVRVLESDPFFQQLPPRMQGSFRRRLAEFNSLPADRRRVRLQLMEPGGGEQAWQALFLRVAPLSLEEQQKALEGDEFFQALPAPAQQKFHRHLERFNSQPPAQRQRMLRRFQHFSQLSPEQQREVRRRARLFAGMSPEQRRRARHVFQGWRQLPPERRRLLVERLRRLQHSSPARRQALFDDPEFLAPLVPDERRLLRGLWHLRQALPRSRSPAGR